MQKNLEMVGRLNLWMAAIDKCISLLKLSNRTKYAITDTSLLVQQHPDAPTFEEFRKLKNDDLTTPPKLSHIFEYKDLYPPYFPTFSEVHTIKESCLMLLAVFFSQLYNSGHEYKGIVASSKTFKDQHYEAILESAFPDITIRNEFKEIAGTLIEARNQMIGHADGAKFDMKHGEQVTSWLHPISSLEKIDPDTLLSFLLRFRNSINEYHSTFK